MAGIVTRTDFDDPATSEVLKQNELSRAQADNVVAGNINAVEGGVNFQGPHDWRKRLRPVKSPIKCDGSSNQLRLVT